MTAIEASVFNTPYGEFVVTKEDALAHTALLRDGCWEPTVLQIAIREARACDLFVDVGAHIGLTTIPILRALPELRAVCVEPHPFNVELLRENLRRNGLEERVTVVQAAAFDTNCKLRFGVSPENTMDHRIVGGGDRYKEPARESVEVDALTLDWMLGTTPGRSVLLKLDVQGHECQALAGATNLLKRTSALLLEYWPYGLKCAGTDRWALQRLLHEAGLDLVAIIANRDVVTVANALGPCLRMLPEDAEGYLDLLLTKE